jgi:hypothetical protein
MFRWRGGGSSFACGGDSRVGDLVMFNSVGRD